jgi:chemotaxis protein MotB
MARKRYKEEEEAEDHTQDRWLVSYADFMTLLFAFFVVMYAISSVNESKYRAISDSLVNAFGRSPAAPVMSGEEPISAPPPLKPNPLQRRNNDALRREKEYMTRIARDLLDVMSPLVREGKVRVTQTSRGVNVEINASVLFAPGDARLTTESSEALKAVGEILKDDHHAIQVEGHTDNVPIRNALFPSNWELSAVRASSVVRLFVDSGVTEGRLTAVGRGSTQPVAANDAAEGRVRNRRVEVIILSTLPDPVREVPVMPVPGG